MQGDTVCQSGVACAECTHNIILREPTLQPHAEVHRHYLVISDEPLSEARGQNPPNVAVRHLQREERNLRRKPYVVAGVEEHPREEDARVAVVSLLLACSPKCTHPKTLGVRRSNAYTLTVHCRVAAVGRSERWEAGTLKE